MATGEVVIKGRDALGPVRHGVDKLDAALKKTGRTAQSTGAKLRSAGKALGPLAAGAGVAAVALAALVDRTLSARNEIGSLAKQSDVSAKLMGALKVATDNAGVSTKQITGSFKKLGAEALKAADGNDAAADKFARLGVEVKDASGEMRSTEAIFREVVGGLGEIENKSERAAVAQTLLSTGAGGLTASLGDLSTEGLAKAEAAAVAFTAHLDGPGLAAAADYEHQMTKISAVVTVIGDAFANLGGPVIGGLVDSVAFASVFLSESLGNVFEQISIRGKILTLDIKGLAAAFEALVTGGPKKAAATLEAYAIQVRGLEAAAGDVWDPLDQLDRIFGKAARTAERVVAQLDSTSAATKALADADEEGEGKKRKHTDAVEEFDETLINFQASQLTMLETNENVAAGFGALTLRAAEYAATLGTVKLEADASAAASAEQAGAWQQSLDGFTSLTGKAADVFADLVSRQEEAPAALKVAYAAMFALNKAAAVSSALVNTALSITAALTIPPPAGQVLAGINAAAGAVQVGAILAEQPAFALGGTMPSTGGAATLHPGEGVMSAGMVDGMGGASALAAGNARSALGGGGGGVTVQWKHLRSSFNHEMRDAGKRPGPTRDIRRDGRRAGQLRRRHQPDNGAT